MRIALILALALTPPARAGLEVWDTGKASAEAYSAAAVEAKTGWTKLAEPGAVQGDAVLTNGRITAVIRRNGGTDLYSAAAARARIAVNGVARLDKIAVTEHSKGAIAIEIQGGGAAATLRLKKGDPAIETSPGAGAARRRDEAASPVGV